MQGNHIKKPFTRSRVSLMADKLRDRYTAMTLMPALRLDPPSSPDDPGLQIVIGEMPSDSENSATRE